MTKAENIAQYKNFCDRNRLAENMESACFFCELYRRKESAANGRAISQIYKYIKTGEA